MCVCGVIDFPLLPKNMVVAVIYMLSEHDWIYFWQIYFVSNLLHPIP